jgi:hypothetical protein
VGVRAKSVLFLAPEAPGRRVTGPARRAQKLAEVVGEHCRVTLRSPADAPDPAEVARHDVVVTQIVPSPGRLLALRRAARHLVVDMIAPLALEVAELPGADPALVRWRSREMVMHLALADLVLCTNDKQRDLLVGAGLAAGLVGGGEPGFRERVAVVPHGLDAGPPLLPSGPGTLRAELGADARIAIWAGGIWGWLDPLTAIRAAEMLRGARPDHRLVFAGYEPPDAEQREAHAAGAAEATAYVRDRGLEDVVRFRPRWLERDEYVGHLLDADAGVVLHGHALEGRFASRTRVVDYLEAGLPVVCSAGDTMSELVTAHGLGAAVAPLDVAGCAAALDRLTADGTARVDARAALGPLLWPNAARPLIDFCLDPRAGGGGASRAAAARAYPAFLRALWATGGPSGLARSALRRAGRARRSAP